MNVIIKSFQGRKRGDSVICINSGNKGIGWSYLTIGKDYIIEDITRNSITILFWVRNDQGYFESYANERFMDLETQRNEIINNILE